MLDEVEKLGAAHVLPTHSPVGDGSLVAKEKAFIVDLRTRALDLKKQGVDAEQAGQSLTAEFKTKYPDWPINNVANFVKSIYADKTQSRSDLFRRLTLRRRGISNLRPQRCFQSLAC